MLLKILQCTGKHPEPFDSLSLRNLISAEVPSQHSSHVKGPMISVSLEITQGQIMGHREFSLAYSLHACFYYLYSKQRTQFSLSAFSSATPILIEKKGKSKAHLPANYLSKPVLQCSANWISAFHTLITSTYLIIPNIPNSKVLT